jgi:hypothetical protein
LGSLLGGSAIIWTACDDEIDFETNQLIGKCLEPLGFIFRIAKLKCDVLTFDIAEPAKLSS